MTTRKATATTKATTTALRFFVLRSLQDGDACDAAGPLLGAGVVDAAASAVDGYGDGHVLDFELVDRLHAEVGEGEDARALDGLRDEVGRAADGDEIDRFELANGGDGGGAALGFADHAEQTGFGGHLAAEIVPSRFGWGVGRGPVGI